MGLFDTLNGGQGQPARQGEPFDYNRAYQEFRGAPGQFLNKAKLGIPEDIDDPNQMLNYLEQSGKVPPAMMNMAKAIAPRLAPMLTGFGRK